jgi:hypothetical protein
VGWKTNADRCIVVCGDSVKMPAEECDDGNIFNGDGYIYYLLLFFRCS